MATVNFYTSNPADRGLLGLATALAQNTGHAVQLRPLGDLPQPDPERRQRLRVERSELEADLSTTEWFLEQYKCGAWKPNAGHEQGLAYDRDALKRRIVAIDRILGAEKGGPGNG